MTLIAQGENHMASVPSDPKPPKRPAREGIPDDQDGDEE